MFDANADAGAAVISQHRFVTALSAQPWERCTICGLAEAAHLTSIGMYTPTVQARRCPDCVIAGIDPCRHA